MSFLGEDPNWVITFKGKGYHLGVRNSDETSRGDPLKFNGLHRVWGDPGYMVYPCYSSVISRDSSVDPVPCLKAVNAGCGIPWDTRYDDFSDVPISGVVGYPEGVEVFSCLAFRVLKIFDSSATRIGNGTSFTETAYSQGVTSCVENERVVENGLSENLRVGCEFKLC
jgi:hypothetical protein